MVSRYKNLTAWVLIEQTGLNNLTGFSFVEAAAAFPPDPDGTNLKGMVILPNPSIVTFELVSLLCLGSSHYLVL